MSLKNWVEFVQDEDWALQVLAQNRVSDEVLDKNDFLLRYGRTAAKEVWPEIESALLAKDKDAYLAALQKIDALSTATLIKKMTSRFAPLEARLKKFGVSADNLKVPVFFDASLRDENEPTRKAVAALLASALWGVYENEFGKTIPKKSEKYFFDALYYALNGYGSEKTGLEEMLRSCLQISGERFAETASGFSAYMQVNEYAPEQLNEYRQSPGLDAIEKTFGIDVRIIGAALADGEIQVLHEVLSEIRTKRPGDFKLLKILHFSFGENRLGGYAEPKPHEIHLIGAFAEPDATYMLSPVYALDSQISLRFDSTRDYLFKLLTHEIAHLVARRDGKKSDGFDVPAKYRTLTPDQGCNPHEWFAEDYSLFLASDGQKLADVTVGGKVIPNYAARLAYFKKHYPLAG